MEIPHRCVVAHLLLANGVCPICNGEHRKDGPADSPTASLLPTKWNIEAAIRMLEHSDIEFRLGALTVLSRCWPPLQDSLVFFRKALVNFDPKVRSAATSSLLMTIGRTIHFEEARSLEKQIRESPFDLVLRIVLLGYYFRNRNLQEAHLNFQAHILHIIHNWPTSDVFFYPHS